MTNTLKEQIKIINRWNWPNFGFIENGAYLQIKPLNWQVDTRTTNENMTPFVLCENARPKLESTFKNGYESGRNEENKQEHNEHDATRQR